MKIKVSNPMLKALREQFPCYSFSIEKAVISDPYLWYEEDYDPKSGLYRVIEVRYPAEYYALPKYITTRDLVKAFRDSDRTYDGFMKAVWRTIEI